MAGLLDITNPMSGLLSPEEAQAAQSNMFLNLGANMLAGSGWQPHPVSLGSIIGQAAIPAMQSSAQFSHALVSAKMMRLQQERLLMGLRALQSQPQQQISNLPPYLTADYQNSALTGAPYNPPQPQQPQASPLGLDPRAIALMMSGDPGLSQIGQMVQKQSEPIAATGPLYKRNPDGSVSLAPGYAEAAAQLNYLPSREQDLKAAEFYQKTGSYPPGYVPPGSQPQAAPRAAPGNVPSPGLSPEQAREIAKQRAIDQPQQLAALNTMSDQFDRLANSAQDIIKDPGLSMATGWTAPMGMVPGTSAKRVSAKIDTLKSQVAFNVLQTLRDMSKSGGALGQVSNFEEKMLMDNLAPLDKAQTKDDFIKALSQISLYANGAKQRTLNSYQQTYGKLPANAITPTINHAPGIKFLGFE